MIDVPTKELHAKTQVIETDQVKADAQIQQTQLELASKERIAGLQAQVDVLTAEISAKAAAERTTIGALAGLDRGAQAAQAGTERVLWGSVAKSVQQLDQQAFQKEQQAQQLQAERDAQQAALAGRSSWPAVPECPGTGSGWPRRGDRRPGAEGVV